MNEVENVSGGDGGLVAAVVAVLTAPVSVPVAIFAVAGALTIIAVVVIAKD